MDHHTVAAISITGTCLDVLGSLYLAYDLLGGQHGPLRLLTRAVTYALVFGIGYGLGPRSPLWHCGRNCHRSHPLDRTQSRCSGTGPLFSALGSPLFGHPWPRFRNWTLPHFGLCLCRHVRLSHHRRPALRLLSRHASGARLRRFSPSSLYRASNPRNRGPHSGLHCLSPALQLLRPSRRPPLAFCHSCWPCHRHRHRRRRHRQSLH